MPNEFTDLDKGALRLCHSVKSCSETFLKLEGSVASAYKYEPFLKLDHFRKMAMQVGKRKVFMRRDMEFAKSLRFGPPEMQSLMDVFESGKLKRENYPVLADFLEGKPIRVKKNSVHLRRTFEHFIPSDEESLKTIFEALTERWLNLPDFLYRRRLDQQEEHPAIKINILRDTLKIKVNSLTDAVSSSMRDYTFSFDTEVLLCHRIDPEFHPEIYQGCVSVEKLDMLKLLWDLFFHGESLKLVQTAGGCFVLLTGDENLLLENTLGVHLDQNCLVPRKPSELPQSMSCRVALFAEIAGCKELLAVAKSLDRLYGDPYWMGRSLRDVLDDPMKSLSLESWDKSIEKVQKFLDGLLAVRNIMEQYARRTKQSESGRLKIGQPAAKLLLEKIRLDPLMYVDDSRKYVAEIARKLIV